MNELPKERLATTDAAGKRVFLYPADVRGHFKHLRRWVHGFLIVFFLAVPWIYWNGQQLVKLDVAHRRFSFFGFHFWAHDVPMVFFFLITFTLLIAFVTAVWGRMWCGWACPQTVFIEGVYRRIERWIEGGPRDRKNRDEGPWTGEKIYKKGLKFFLFLIVSLIITHSFLAYFVGSRELIQMITAPPEENWASFLVILFTTGIIWGDFGWFREQFCVIMCPYGRFQSVLMDDNSLVVAYDGARGEPRRGEVPSGGVQGDCVNCSRCVQVCPTGVDIRRGVQMECIACTACIDACDEVMTKTKKPLGLIRYTSLNQLHNKPVRKFRPRTIAYATFLTAAVLAFIFVLSKKEMLQVTLLRAKEIPYQAVPVANGVSVINHLKLDVANQYDDSTTVTVSLPEEEKTRGFELVMAINPAQMSGNEQRKMDVFLRFPQTALPGGSGHVKVVLESPKWEKPKTVEVTLVGPNR